MDSQCVGKRRFRDQKEALRTIRTLAKRSTRDTVPHRAYFCPTCKGHHLTSRAER